MDYQNTFRRVEIKYLITTAQKAALLDTMSAYMLLDKYGRTTIRNLYFDTEQYRLIRRSMEKPIYKEKMRLRSYALAEADTPIFVELKKKYKSVVYKRRLTMPERTVLDAFSAKQPFPDQSQIGKEIEYFRDYYETLSPKVFLCYDREAYKMRDGSDFRVTFDDTILYRTTDLSLSAPAFGVPILPEGYVLMEVKTAGALPLWLTTALTEQQIFKTSFSKYGMAYTHLQQSTQKGVLTYV